MRQLDTTSFCLSLPAPRMFWWRVSNRGKYVGITSITYGKGENKITGWGGYALACRLSYDVCVADKNNVGKMDYYEDFLGLSKLRVRLGFPMLHDKACYGSSFNLGNVLPVMVGPFDQQPSQISKEHLSPKVLLPVKNKRTGRYMCEVIHSPPISAKGGIRSISPRISSAK